MTNYPDILAHVKGGYRQLEKSLAAKVLARTEFEVRLKNLEKAQAFLQTIAQDTQMQLKIHIEDIVQLALDAIFPDQYQFAVQFAIAYGKTIAELVFVSTRSGYTIDPMIASGGGVVDVCSFALRLACWTLSRGTDKVIVLDEPFRFLSVDLQDRAGLLLKELSQKLGIQIILTTHLAPLIDAADKSFEIVLNKKGVSVVSDERL